MIAAPHGIAILDALEGVKSNGQDSWMAQCPCHEDSTASLSITREGDKTLVYCHAGCDTRDVVAASGLTMADLGPRNANGSAPHVDKVYDYRDADGSLISQVVKMLPKDFRQRRADGTPSVKGCKVVPYRLPEIVRADPAAPVFVVEGEKDCDNLAKLGIIATCNAGGAGKWRAVHAEHLKGRHVVVLPDNDDPGRKHAEQVAATLAGIARSVKTVELPGLPEKGDVSDWLAAGGTAAKLLELAAESSDEAAAFPKFTLGELTEKFRTLSPPVIHGFIREGETANFIANPKTGKSWTMYGLAINVVTGSDWLGLFPVSQGRVLLIDNELHPETLAHRIPAVGNALARPFEDYRDGIDTWCLRGNLRSLQQLLVEFRKSVEPRQYKLIIFDAKYRFAAEGTSENDNAAETAVYNLLDQIAAETRSALIVVHHASKGGQSDKRVTDVGAGAGAQSRAADCHMVLREHEDEGIAVLDAAVRSFPPVAPVALRWSFPIWIPDEFADAAKLKGKQTRNEERTAERDKEGIDKIIAVLITGPATASVIRQGTGISKDRCDRLLNKLTADDQIRVEMVKVKGNECREYHVVDG